MEVTWRKWLAALVLILLLLAACDLFAQHYLADWYELIHPFALWLNFQALTVYHDTWVDFDDQSKLDAWYESTARAMTDWIEVPWPIRPTPPVRDLLDTDPATVGTSDPQTLLGLAMLAKDPVTVLGSATGDLHSPDPDQRRDPAFRQYVLMALSAAHNDDTRRRLDRLVLYLESVMPLHEHAAYWAAAIPLTASTRTDTQPALTATELLDVLSRDQARSAQFESQREDYLSARAHTLDPTNMLYIYRQANRHLGEWIIEGKSLDSSTDPQLPSECLAQTLRLTDPESLLPRARQLDAALTDHVPDAAFHLHKADAREMLRKAIAHHWPRAVPKGLTQFAAAAQPFADGGTLSGWRHTVKRLCFLGDRLADQRQDQLALRMYRHANTLGRQLTDGDLNDRTMLDVLVGHACIRMVTDHLTEFWSRRGDVDRTWKATRHAAVLQRHITDVSRWLHQPTVDPIGRNDDTYRGYTRATGLTWWYAYTAIALTALSIAAALIYLPLRPRKAAATPEPAALPPLAWPIVLAPILAMAWLGLVIPLRLDSMQALAVTLVWAQLLTGVWVMAIGMYATRRSSLDAPAGAHRTPVWLGVILTVAVLAAVINGSASSDSAAAIATAAVLALGLVIWLIAMVVGVFKTRSPDRRLSQAQAVKAFAITAMVAGLISIAAALVTMPLTWRHQINYFKLSADSLTKEAHDCVRQTTPVDPLPDELFSLDPAPTSSATL